MPKTLTKSTFIPPPAGKTLVLHYAGKNGLVFDALRFSSSPKWPEIGLKFSIATARPVITLDVGCLRSAIASGEVLPPVKVWSEGLRIYFPELSKKMEIPLGALVARIEQHVGPGGLTPEVRSYCSTVFASYEADYKTAMKGIKIRVSRHVPMENRKRLSHSIFDLCLLQNWPDLKARPVTIQEGLKVIAGKYEATARILVNCRRMGKTEKRRLARKVTKTLRLLTVDKWCPFEVYLSRRRIKLASRHFRRSKGHKDEQAMKLFYKMFFRIVKTPATKLDPKDYDRFCRVLSYEPTDG